MRESERGREREGQRERQREGGRGRARERESEGAREGEREGERERGASYTYSSTSTNASTQSRHLLTRQERPKRPDMHSQITHTQQHLYTYTNVAVHTHTHTSKSNMLVTAASPEAILFSSLCQSRALPRALTQHFMRTVPHKSNATLDPHTSASATCHRIWNQKARPCVKEAFCCGARRTLRH